MQYGLLPSLHAPTQIEVTPVFGNETAKVNLGTLKYPSDTVHGNSPVLYTHMPLTESVDLQSGSHFDDSGKRCI